MENHVSVSIKERYYKRIEKEIEESFSFKTVEEYINKILELLFSETKEDFEKDIRENEALARRLKDLGYMD